MKKTAEQKKLLAAKHPWRRLPLTTPPGKGLQHSPNWEFKAIRR